jgi:hypothetical protein
MPDHKSVGSSRLRLQGGGDREEVSKSPATIFDQVAASIETLLNMETIIVNELIGRLNPSKE